MSLPEAGDVYAQVLPRSHPATLPQPTSVENVLEAQLVAGEPEPGVIIDAYAKVLQAAVESSRDRLFFIHESASARRSDTLETEEGQQAATADIEAIDGEQPLEPKVPPLKLKVLPNPHAARPVDNWYVEPS